MFAKRFVLLHSVDHRFSKVLYKQEMAHGVTAFTENHTTFYLSMCVCHYRKAFEYICKMYFLMQGILCICVAEGSHTSQLSPVTAALLDSEL